MLNQYEFTDKQFNDFLVEESGRIRGLFKKLASKDPKQSTIPPMLVVVMPSGNEGGVTAAPLILSGNTDGVTSGEVMFEIGKQAYQNRMQPLAIFLSTEAWARHADDPDDSPPNENDEEVIFTAGLTIDDRSNFAASHIVRKESGPDLADPDVILYDPNNPEDPDEELQQFFIGYLSGMTSGAA